MMDNSYKYSPETASRNHGTRWAREEEIRKGLLRTDLAGTEKTAFGGIPVISDGRSVCLDAGESHTLIYGGTASGKTRRIILPMLETLCRAGESCVVTDPKGELFQMTAPRFEKNGYQVLVINLRNPRRSHAWNPLALARAYAEAGDEEKATAMINDFAATFLPEYPGSKADPFWTFSSRAMLRGMCSMMTEKDSVFSKEEVNLYTLRMLSDHLMLESDEETSFDLLDYYSEHSIARYNLDAIRRGSEKTFDNIRVSYDAPMQQLYMQRSLMDMLSGNNVDFSRLGREKTVLYLIIPDEKSTLNGVASLIIKSCYMQLIDEADAAKDKRLPVRVNFVLDEFANLAPVPDAASMLSAGRSRNIRFTLVTQGLHQLVSKYGADDADTIKGNCANWIFFFSREVPLLEELSTLCGSDGITGDALISVSQLQRLSKERGEVLMLLGRNYPYIANLPDISRYSVTYGEDAIELPVLPSVGCQTVSMREALDRAERRKRGLPPDEKLQKEAGMENNDICLAFDSLFGDMKKSGRRRK